MSDAGLGRARAPRLAGHGSWSGQCPAGKHGLDFEGQDCDVCRHDAGGPCGRDCRRCWAKRGYLR